MSGSYVPIILSGGAGTRLWPISREQFPKQFHALDSNQTLLQETIGRFTANPVIVCNEEHRFIVTEQLREVQMLPRCIIIEPEGRNTAPAATLAALMLERDSPDTLMVISPADHVIRDPALFAAALEVATPLARQGWLVTFGIIPDAPNTGYGYIQRGPTLGNAYAVARFVEKPIAAVAEDYVKSGDYYWNSGIFLFSVRSWIEEMEKFAPDTLSACRLAVNEGAAEPFTFRPNAEHFRSATNQSIDYAVMERTSRAAVVPVDMGWSDIGSWSALLAHSDLDTNGNAVIGDVLAIDTKGSYLRTEKHLVVTLGLQDVIVVSTEDATLVAAKDRDQDIKKVIEVLRHSKRKEGSMPWRCYRPWGWFQTMDEGDRFKVKQIMVNPSHKLSLQKHWHRCEHWVVASGTALVTCGDKEFVLRENESTFIPAGTIHRLENPGRVPLRIIEVQSGAYLCEDDIVRLDDIYGRAEETTAHETNAA